MGKFENRIVGHGMEKPDQLLAHPDNFRIHSYAQQDLTRKAMSKVGWVDDVTVNQRTGRVLDGHMRIALAMREGEATVPVKFVDLSEEEEKFVLRTFDPLGELASFDFEKLQALHSEVLEQPNFEGFTGDPEEFTNILQALGKDLTLKSNSPPEDFPEVDEGLPVNKECPKCGYKWSAG